MARGLWVSPNEFVSFAEPNKTLTEQIASRSRSIDFFGLGMYLPNPDPILKSQGRDIRIYRELRTDPLVGGCIRRRKAAVKSLERGLERGHAPARVSGPWLITTARHAFDRNSGYITELEVARGPVTQGKAKKGKKTGKTQTLTVYKPDGSTSTVIKEKK
ncbi:hypothetical protein TUM16664_11870 [Enterobacter cloacae]|nr:hypothetical protein TUM16664_11870 [Enterobacter cloacae]